MWNAVYLEGVSKTKILNLDEAVKKICIAIKNNPNICCIKASNSTIKKLIKAQRLLDNEAQFSDVVYELIKTTGLSKRAFKRTLSYIERNNVDIFYVNYKYLDYIISRLVKYILIIDSGILNDLFETSKKYYAGEDSVTFRTIPVRKALIHTISKEYNDGRECSLRNKYFQKQVFLLNQKLDEINLVWRTTL